MPRVEFPDWRDILADETAELEMRARLDDPLVLDGTDEKVDCPRFHGRNGHFYVPMGGQKHDRNLYLGPGEFLLQFKSAHSGQAHVEDYAA